VGVGWFSFSLAEKNEFLDNVLNSSDHFSIGGTTGGVHGWDVGPLPKREILPKLLPRRVRP
jgi:hypothetical protein